MTYSSSFDITPTNKSSSYSVFFFFPERGWRSWDRNNADQQGLVRLDPTYRVLAEKAPLAVQAINPDGLWAHMRRDGAIDRATIEELQVGLSVCCSDAFRQCYNSHD